MNHNDLMGGGGGSPTNIYVPTSAPYHLFQCLRSLIRSSCYRGGVFVRPAARAELPNIQPSLLLHFFTARSCGDCTAYLLPVQVVAGQAL